MMKLHHIKGYIQSIYLAEYTDKLLLLDGCCRADIEPLKHFITTQLHRPLTDLTLIVVTHMHPDHAGAAHKLRQLTGCKIASANVNGHWYCGFSGRLMHLTDIMLARWVAKRQGKPSKNLWYSSKLMPDHKLNDGDTVPGFSQWQVFATQGHTDRDLSVYHTPSHRVYVADLFVKIKGRYLPPYPLFYPNRYRVSLNKIKTLAPTTVMLAHGGEVKVTDEEYQQVIDSAPTIPLTHWRSVKIRLRKLLRL